MLLLVTDGESTAGLVPPMEAARLAVREGVRIYAIGVGSNKEEVMILGTDGQYQEESDIGMDENALTRIAGLTGQKGLIEFVADHFPGQVMVQRIGGQPYPSDREGA